MKRIGVFSVPLLIGALGALSFGLFSFSSSRLPAQAQQVPPLLPAAEDGGGAGGPLFNFTGKLTLLRVHDVGSGFGPPGDAINVEVVFKLNTHPARAFGFQLRNDANRPARQGMLDILRDGFNNNFTVSTDAMIEPTENNGVSIRVWLTKP
jgi:hypothetical protein